MVFERVVLSAGFIALVVGGLTVLSGFSELSWWMSVPIIVGGGCRGSVRDTWVLGVRRPNTAAARQMTGRGAGVVLRRVSGFLRVRDVMCR